MISVPAVCWLAEHVLTERHSSFVLSSCQFHIFSNEQVCQTARLFEAIPQPCENRRTFQVRTRLQVLVRMPGTLEAGRTASQIKRRQCRHIIHPGLLNRQLQLVKNPILTGNDPAWIAVKWGLRQTFLTFENKTLSNSPTLTDGGMSRLVISKRGCRASLAWS